MEHFTTSDGIEIAYREWGPDGGEPVVLHHGFIADGIVNWKAPGVVGALTDAGYRVIAPDARGHGRSGKPHDPACYGEARMAQDLSELFDHLGLASLRLVGYSMGAIVALLTTAADSRVRRLVVGGIGRAAVHMGGVDRDVIDPELLAGALTAPDPTAIVDDEARLFRAFAEATGGDLLALAAQARSVHRDPIPFDRITVPTLLFAGTEDDLARSPDELAGAISDCSLAQVPGDHQSAIGAEAIERILAFLTADAGAD